MAIFQNPFDKKDNSLAGLRAVVADDDPASRELVQYMLQKWGMDVHVASNGTDAWELLRTGDTPTIVVLDWVMPGLDGVELCRRIRGLPRQYYTYSILLSCKDDRNSLIEGLQAGADDYIRKPLDPDEFEARMGTAARTIAFKNHMAIAQERLALAEDGGRSGSFDWDLRNNVISCSPGVEKLYGLEIGTFSGTYEAWEALVFPEDLLVVRNAIRESFKTGEFAAEWRIQRQGENEASWISGRANVFFDNAGNPVHMVGINMDITAQKLAEKKLKEQAALLDLAHDAVFVLGMDRRLVFWNRGAQSLYGWSAKEALGQRPHELLQTRYPVPFEEIRDTLLKQNHWEGELVHIARNGTRIIVASRWSLQRDETGAPLVIMGINRDITRSKQAEARLKVREAITSILAEAENLAVAVPKIMRVVCECMHWEIGELWGVDGRHQILRHVEEYCVDTSTQEFEQISRTMAFQKGQDLPGRSWRERQTVWTENATTDKQFSRTALALKCGLRGALAFPILQRGEVSAVMMFFTRDSHVFDIELTELFASIGSQIGQFVSRKQSERGLALSEEHHRNLVEASTALICIHDLEGKIQLINPAAAHSLGYPAESVIGRNVRDFLDPAAQPGFDVYLKDLGKRGASSGRMAVRDSQGRKHVWFFTNRLMHDEGKPPYVLGHAQDITELIEAQKALHRSQHSALEIEKRLSRSDPLTGLANRRAFYETAEMERKRACRYRRPLSIAYIDLDNFKQINDEAGHQTGDQVLARVAQILSRNMRAESVAARLGGDEFALLLPEAGYAAANTAVNKLHRMLTEAMERENWPVTFSVGVVTYNRVPDNTDQMVHAADELMYTVKNGGKGFIAATSIGGEPIRLIQ